MAVPGLKAMLDESTEAVTKVTYLLLRLDPEHNSVQLSIFLKLLLATPDMGKSRNQEQALCRHVLRNNGSTDDANELEKVISPEQYSQASGFKHTFLQKLESPFTHI